MPTYNIASTNRDCHSAGNGEYPVPSSGPYNSAYVGYDGGGGGYFDGAWIWDTSGPNVIPQGATILTASVLVNRQSTDYAAGFLGNWYGFLVTSLTDFTALHNTHRASDHHTRTTANVADDSWANAASHTSPSLVSIIQEIVNQGAFAGVLGLTYRVRAADAGYFNFVDYSDSAANSAALTVTWATGAASKPRLRRKNYVWRRSF